MGLKSVPPYHKTKIVCTLGPSSSSYQCIKHLVLAGMDVARLNFSYGTYSEFSQVIAHIRRVEKELRKPVGILQDLQGPKIRLGHLLEPLQVRSGDSVLFDSGTSRSKAVPVNYSRLTRDLKAGDRILIGDGALAFQVGEVSRRGVHARALTAGFLKPHQGVHFPGVRLKIGALTKKDLRDFKFGLEHGVDFVALSFVTSERDIESLRRGGRGARHSPLFISKIERSEAVDQLDRILEASDGAIVARGDLGLEMGLEEIPLLQKRIIHKAAYYGKFVITATQLLESMIEKVSPTRAEVSDVANSVLDGTDAVLLSGETAAGRFPIQSVEMLVKILQRVERDSQASPRGVGRGDQKKASAFALAQAAREVSDEMQIDRIVPFTYSGITALRVSKMRPRSWIIAMTPSLQAWRRMSLFWGVRPILTRMVRSTDEMFRTVERGLKGSSLGGVSKSIVLIAGIPFRRSATTNLLKVHEI